MTPRNSRYGPKDCCSAGTETGSGQRVPVQDPRVRRRYSIFPGNAPISWVNVPQESRPPGTSRMMLPYLPKQAPLGRFANRISRVAPFLSTLESASATPTRPAAADPRGVRGPSCCEAAPRARGEETRPPATPPPPSWPWETWGNDPNTQSRREPDHDHQNDRFAHRKPPSPSAPRIPHSQDETYRIKLRRRHRPCKEQALESFASENSE